MTRSSTCARRNCSSKRWNEFPDIHRRLHRQALHEQAEVDAASAGQDAKDAPRAPFLTTKFVDVLGAVLEPPEGYDRTDSPPPEKEEEDEVAVSQKKSRLAAFRAAGRLVGMGARGEVGAPGGGRGVAVSHLEIAGHVRRRGGRLPKLAAPASPAMKKLSGLFVRPLRRRRRRRCRKQH